MTRGRSAGVLLATAAVAAVLAGCSSPTPTGTAPTGPVSASTVRSPSPTPSATTASGSVTAPSSATATPSAPRSRPASSPATSSTPAPRSTCRQLAIRVIIGGAAPNYEFAALQFVNTGSSTCVLSGAPTVTLAHGGSVVGSPSQPTAAAATATFRLAPGATAQSQLRDFSTCNAPLSDTITVVAPGSTITSSRPGELRACTLRVYPLQKSD